MCRAIASKLEFPKKTTNTLTDLEMSLWFTNRFALQVVAVSQAECVNGQLLKVTMVVATHQDPQAPDIG